MARTYAVRATQPVDSKLKSQRVRFTSITKTADGSTTKYFTINTGKYKTVAQLDAYLHDAFAKFLAGAPANAEVGKVGDIKYGGEIRFVVESPGCPALQHDNGGRARRFHDPSTRGGRCRTPRFWQDGPAIRQ